MYWDTVPNLRRYLERGGRKEGRGGREMKAVRVEWKKERKGSKERRRRKGWRQKEERRRRREDGREKWNGENILLWVTTFHLERRGGRRAHLRVFYTSSPAMVVGREAAHTPSRFNVFSSIPDASTSGGAYWEGKREGEKGGGGERGTYHVHMQTIL